MTTTEYTVNVVAVSTPPIIGVEVVAGCGSGSGGALEVYAQPTEPATGATDLLWVDTSAPGSVGTAGDNEVVVSDVEPTGPWEVWVDVANISQTSSELANELTTRVIDLEARLRLLEIERGG